MFYLPRMTRSIQSESEANDLSQLLDSLKDMTNSDGMNEKGVGLACLQTFETTEIIDSQEIFTRYLKSIRNKIEVEDAQSLVISKLTFRYMSTDSDLKDLMCRTRCYIIADKNLKDL